MSGLKFTGSAITVIVAAMELELAPFLEATEVSCSASVGGQDFHVGQFAGQQVLLIQSGIGLVEGAAAASRALAFCAAQGVTVTRYLCVGTCGGLAAETSVRDVIVGTSFVYSRADATIFGYAPGQVPGQPPTFPGDLTLADQLHQVPAERTIFFGQVASSDAFVTAANVEDTRQRFPAALAVDMESTAAAQVCFHAGVPFLSVRGVSDLCGPTADKDFHVDAEDAALVSFRMVAAWLAAEQE